MLEESITYNSPRYSKVRSWNGYLIEDERVITGQNPVLVLMLWLSGCLTTHSVKLLTIFKHQ